MELPHAWWEEAYAAMLRVLRKRFGERDLIYEAAAERWIEIRCREGPPLAAPGELVGLCLKYVRQRGLDGLRAQSRLKQKEVPLFEVADGRADPGRDEVRAMLWVLEGCLGRLSARRQELLRAYYEQGLSDRQIAARWARSARSRRGRRGTTDGEKRAAGKARRRAIETDRKAVSRERRAALEALRLLFEAEAARADCAAA